MSKQPGFIIADIAGLTLSQRDIELLSHPFIGGIILFARNYESPEQLLALTKHIKRIKPDCFIGVDQEGGRVQRFQTGLSKLPNMHGLGQLYDANPSESERVLQIASDIGHLMALELVSLGIDMSFAPVLDLATDLNTIVKDRAIHKNPEVVSLIATHYINGMRLAGMSACGKHFPGHGHVHTDSHYELPVDDRLLPEMEADLKPFRDLIQHGIEAIMPGHLLFPKVDASTASLSRLWLHDILREKLHFKGTIISDDMCMKATHEVGDIVSCVESALQAGCDYVLICNDQSSIEKVIDNIKLDYKHLQKAHRLNIFAKPRNVTWDALHEQPEWLAARHSLDELNQFVSSYATKSNLQ